MSNPDLASMTLKDLRQLASEHALPNRSRLAKQDLIEALNQMIVSKTDDAPAEQDDSKTKKKADAQKAEAPKAEAKKAKSSKKKADEKSDEKDKDNKSEKEAKKADGKQAKAESDDEVVLGLTASKK